MTDSLEQTLNSTKSPKSIKERVKDAAFYAAATTLVASPLVAGFYSGAVDDASNLVTYAPAALYTGLGAFSGMASATMAVGCVGLLTIFVGDPFDFLGPTTGEATDRALPFIAQSGLAFGLLGGAAGLAATGVGRALYEAQNYIF